MQRYLQTFRRVFPGARFIFASLIIILGVFTLIYALAVHQGFFLRSFITDLDKNILEVVLIQRGDTRSAFFLFFTYLANWEIIASLSAVIIAMLTLARKVRAMWFFIISLTIGQFSSLLFKYLLSRSRPDTTHALIEQSGYSFPSGHALGAFIFYGILAYFLTTLVRRHRYHIVIALSATLLISLIGISRLYLGVHWLSDIIAGWIMGATLLIVFIVFFEHRKTLFPVSHRAPFITRPMLIVIGTILSASELLFIFWYYLAHPIT